MTPRSRREAHVFLQHAAGHRVPVHLRALPVRDGSGSIIGAVEVFEAEANAPATTRRIAELEDRDRVGVADRFRALVRSSNLREGSVSVTVSVGAAQAEANDTPESLRERVDQLLYRSKREGRDRTSA